MGKGRRNQRNPDYFKLQGGAVEDGDLARKSKQALASQKAGPKRLARSSTKRAPTVTKETRPAPKPIPEAAYPTPTPRGLLRHVLDDTLGIARWVTRQIFELLRGRRREPSSV